MNDIRLWDFYMGPGTDQDGRTFEDILALSDPQIAEEHGFIQWLFPTREPSQFNPEAPLLDGETQSLFKHSSKVRERVARATGRMMRFFLHTNWCRPGSHHLLRVTRMLKFLKAVNQEAAAYALFEFARCELMAQCMLGDPALTFWENALRG